MCSVNSPFLPKHLIRSSSSLIFLDEPPSDEDVKVLAEETLKSHPIAGPIYHYVNKRLACIFLKEMQEELAVFHLTEGHGCTLRHQALYRYDRMVFSEKSSSHEIELGRSLREIMHLEGKYTTEKYEGLLSRLGELPSEWVIVQLTVQYDSMLRITHEPTKSHPIHLSRMSCGNLSHQINSNKQGGPPFTVLSSPDPLSSGVVPIIKKIEEELKQVNSSKHSQTNVSSVFSDKLQSLITEFEELLGDINCLLPGNLVDISLHKKVCAKVDQIVKKHAISQQITKRQVQILYLLATSPGKLKSKQSKILNSFFEDSCLVAELYKKIVEVNNQYSLSLSTAPRHPVIIILDEFLDVFPIEMVDVLKRHPVSRVPSIHFAHALYREHSDTIFRSGISSEDGYYIVNPSGDLVECEKRFRQLLPSVAPKWDGIFGTVPTESQFVNALSKKSIFLYCGHGGGNQFVDATTIERVRTQAVSFLMGCSSTQIIQLGGRVDGLSLFNSYMIGGCPCTVGMLWNVTDADANRMTDYFLKRWLKPVDTSTPDTIEVVCSAVNGLNINVQNELAAEPDLLRIIPLARHCGKHLRNTAALVARGLPVKIRWT